MQPLSIRRYAAHRKARGLLGAIDQAVRKAIETGRISRHSDGKIDPGDADRQWLEHSLASPADAVPDAGKSGYPGSKRLAVGAD